MFVGRSRSHPAAGVVPLRAVLNAGNRRSMLPLRRRRVQVTRRLWTVGVPYRVWTSARVPSFGCYFSPSLTSSAFANVWRDGGRVTTVSAVALGKVRRTSRLRTLRCLSFCVVGRFQGLNGSRASDAFRAVNRLSVTPVQKFGCSMHVCSLKRACYGNGLGRNCAVRLRRRRSNRAIPWRRPDTCPAVDVGYGLGHRNGNRSCRIAGKLPGG